MSAGVLAAEAAAHVTLSPSFVTAEETGSVSFEAPNERAPHRTVGLSVTAPPGVEISAAAAPSRWTLAIDGRTARWTGGSIRGIGVVSFPLGITAHTRAGDVVFRAEQRYDDDATVRWEATLTVLPATGSNAPAEHPERALIAAIVGLVVLTASLFVLVLVRRRPLHRR